MKKIKFKLGNIGHSLASQKLNLKRQKKLTNRLCTWIKT